MAIKVIHCHCHCQMIISMRWCVDRSKVKVTEVIWIFWGLWGRCGCILPNFVHDCSWNWTCWSHCPLFPGNWLIGWSGLTLAQVMQVAWWHQAITWANVDLSLVRFSDIHLKAISQKPSITKISLKIVVLILCSNFPGANELTNNEACRVLVLSFWRVVHLHVAKHCKLFWIHQILSFSLTFSWYHLTLKACFRTRNGFRRCWTFFFYCGHLTLFIITYD